MIRCFDIDSGEVVSFEDEMVKMKLQNIAAMYANIPGNESSPEDIFKALWADYEYKQNLYKKTDQLLDYNDEIVEIEELDEAEMYDISVGGDELFYANGVLTKNSSGLPATADFMLGVIETEELAKMGVQLLKQIKSRYGDKNYYTRFNVGVKKGNQRWYEVPNQIADQENAQVKPQSAQQAEKREKLDELANNMVF